MRHIAKNAKVGLSNIYNYFDSKDDIFLEVVNPAKNALYTFVREQHTEDCIISNQEAPFGCKEEILECYIDLIYQYKEESSNLIRAGLHPLGIPTYSSV